MKLEHFLNHMHTQKLSRRQMMSYATKAGVAGAFAVGLHGLDAHSAHAGEEDDLETMDDNIDTSGGIVSKEAVNDDMFDVAAVEGGAWVPSRYGAGDQRGAFNEITPQTTARAMRLLDRKRPVVTYNMGELLFNGFPAFRTTPPRLYQQQLTVLGYQPPADFKGILQGLDPLGPNKVSVHEERFKENATYQIATQLDNLNHIGVGAMFYNGFKGPDIAGDSGTKALGNEHMGPIVTRGILLDIVGLKVAQGATNDYFRVADGRPVMRDNYRVTLDDIEAAMKRANLKRIRPGDVVLFRLGWNQLVRTDPDRYLAQEPGIYLRETRWLAQFRPAIIGGDTWGLEVLDPAVTNGNAFPCHQELLVRYGIRIGEGVVSDKLAEDGVFEFVYMTNPQYALGATCGNTPPVALGQPKR
jgi:Putative cyclase